MANHPSDIEAMLNDPEGQQLVRAIQSRKGLAELRERIGTSLMRHRVIRDGITEPSGWCETCGNLADCDQELHQAEVLVGLRQEAIAAAWDQGADAGYKWALIEDPHMSPEDESRRPVNPYRTVSK
jgi:hypothetical protein